VNDCRGLILDEANGWAVVGIGFSRFANHGESWAAQINWERAKVYEKLDGTMVLMWFYDDKWHVSTRGSASGSGSISSFIGGFQPKTEQGTTFAELFWSCYAAQKLTLPRWHDYCFIWELTSPHNRVVIPYADARITLLGVRNRNSFLEQKPGPWVYNLGPGCKTPEEFQATGFQALQNTFLTTSPTQLEGYVVVDDQFNRVKIKHPGYVVLHRLKSGVGPKYMLNVIRMGEKEEVVSTFPELLDEMNRISTPYEVLVETLERAWEEHRGLQTAKDFAVAVRGLPMSSVLFALRHGTIGSVREGLRTCNLNSLIRAVDEITKAKEANEENDQAS
jgi:hypothetical protein